MEIEYKILYKHISNFICKIYQIYDLNQYCDYNTLIYFSYSKLTQQTQYKLINNNENFIQIVIYPNIESVEITHGNYMIAISYITYRNHEKYIDISFDLIKSTINTYNNIFNRYIKEHEDIMFYKDFKTNKNIFTKFGFTDIKSVFTPITISFNIELYKLNNLELTIFPES
uniref:Uncharacterized protein n=1 Tax=Pithovirus LCDPAC02 TaxID=2506601 RepID=A0A481YPE3_9VIRU|nr:MAG: hypothetical protein LCDPAC02_01090 [Pithovirus LCDPAC02]